MKRGAYSARSMRNLVPQLFVGSVGDLPLPCESICSKELGPGAVFASVMPTVPACNGGVGWVIELAAHVADPKTCHTWPSRSDRLTGVNGIVFSGVVV